MEVNLKEDERIDDLEYKGLKIIQNKKWFCFGIDSVLLSDFAKEIKNNSTVLDLGSGTGIISILLSKSNRFTGCFQMHQYVHSRDIMSDDTISYVPYNKTLCILPDRL